MIYVLCNESAYKRCFPTFGLNSKHAFELRRKSTSQALLKKKKLNCKQTVFWNLKNINLFNLIFHGFKIIVLAILWLLCHKTYLNIFYLQTESEL